MLRALVVFFIAVVLLLVLMGSAGAVGPYELLLAVIVAFAVAFAARRKSHAA